MNVICPFCFSKAIRKFGLYHYRKVEMQKWKCEKCNRVTAFPLNHKPKQKKSKEDMMIQRELLLGVEAQDNVKVISYQEPFPLTKICSSSRCHTEAILVALCNDKDKVIKQMRPSGAYIWPHDSVAIALYFCPKCGNIVVDWNQA